MSNKIVIVISTVSLIVSVVAICLVLMRCEPIEAEWAAIEVTVLSVLVTALLGWQIWNAIRFEERMNDVNKRFDDKMLRIANDINHVALATEYKWEAQEILSAPENPSTSVEYWIKALEEAMKTEISGVNKSVINGILTDAKEYIDYYKQKGRDLQLTDEQKESYISVAKRVEDDRVVDLILYISKAKSI